MGQPGTDRPSGAVAGSAHFGLDQPVVAAASPVNHVNLALVNVKEHVEVVSQELHLVDGLFLIHRDHGKPLDTGDARPFIGFLFRRLALGSLGCTLSIASKSLAPALALVAVSYTHLRA